MGKLTSTRAEQKAYFTEDRLNASTLKGLDEPHWVDYRRRNPDSNKFEARHFRIGDAIDCMMTTPEAFADEFQIISGNRPSGKMGVFADALPLGLTPDSDQSAYTEAYQKAEYKYPIGSVIDWLWQKEPYREYYVSKQNPTGKTVLSMDEMDEVEHCRTMLFKNPWIRDIWLNTDPNKDCSSQVRIFYTIKSKDGTVIECKSMLDRVVVDLKEKTFQPYDLKSTAGKPQTFSNSYIKFKYYLQGGKYDMALKSDEFADQFFQAYGVPLSEFKILPMQFIVVSKKHLDAARIFAMTENEVVLSKNGGRFGKGEKVRGIYDLIEDYQWHIQKNYWEMPKAIYENNSVVILDELYI